MADSCSVAAPRRVTVATYVCYFENSQGFNAKCEKEKEFANAKVKGRSSAQQG